MAVSVRMESLLERELELAAQRRGISKSQFIIEAVERALGHKDPGQLLLQVREEFAPLRAAEAAAGGPVPPEGQAGRLRDVLRERHAADLDDWLQRQTPAVQAAVPAAKSARVARTKGVQPATPKRRSRST
jgi:RHH-type rel operon transcriptional repressor/antitoxin RelB